MVRGSRVLRAHFLVRCCPRLVGGASVFMVCTLRVSGTCACVAEVSLVSNAGSVCVCVCAPLFPHGMEAPPWQPRPTPVLGSLTASADPVGLGGEGP